MDTSWEITQLLTLDYYTFVPETPSRLSLLPHSTRLGSTVGSHHPRVLRTALIDRLHLYRIMLPRRPRPSLPPAPPFPAIRNALYIATHDLPAYIDSLALPSSYSTTTADSRAHLKAALYSFALDEQSPFRSLLFQEGQAPSVQGLQDDWTLAAAQGDGAGGEYSPARRGKVCGHVFRAGESVYRCRDCSLDATCVLCAKCFHGSSHARRGHDVTMSVHAGVGAGCCDCGDVEAFVEGAVADCKYHAVQEGAMGEEETTGQDDAELVERLKEEVQQRLEVLVEWMIEVVDGSPEEMTPPTSVEDIMQAIAAPNPEQEDTPHLPLPSPSISASTSATPSPLQVSTSSLNYTDNSMDTEADPLATSGSTFDPNPSADASSPSTLRGTSPPTYVSSTSRGKAREILSSSVPSLPNPEAPAGPWSVILWNDEKHSFSQVIDIVANATGISRIAASQVAQRVDTHGREIIFISSDPAQLLAVTKKIAAIELGVTVRGARETFAEMVVGELIGVMRDLCAVKVNGEGGVLSEVLARVLLERCGGGVGGSDGVEGESRFQKLVKSDAKLWKEARKGLAEVFVTLLGVSAEVKMEISMCSFTLLLREE